MKKLFLTIICILAMAVTARAADVSFQWAANIEADLAGYMVYRSPTSGSGYIERGIILCASGDTPCCVFTDVNVPDGTWYWVVYAKDIYNNISMPSVELTKTIESLPGPPAQVQNFRFQGE